MATQALVVVGAGIVAACLVLSAFFSSSETAIFSLPEGWIEAQVSAGDPRADELADLRGDPHRLLVTILVGNNVVNVALTSVLTAVFVASLPTGLAVTVATVVASVLVLVFGEIVPKSFGLGNARGWSLTVARPLRIIELTLLPVVLAFDAVTRGLSSALGGDEDLEGAYVDR